MLAVLMICRENLVSGFIVATMSTIWNRACWLLLIAFWPVIKIIGIAPRCAYAAPVAKFSAPGPSVLIQTPGLPVNRP